MMDARLVQLSATEKRVEELSQQLEAKYSAFVGKLESTNMDQLYKYCQDMNKSINTKLGIALGGVAIAVKANCLEKASLEEARNVVNEKLGKCDILINGAGGNNPRGTTTKEYYEKGDENLEGITSFFNLDPKGVEFVFNLNFIGTLLPTQVFAQDMVGREGCNILNIKKLLH